MKGLIEAPTLAFENGAYLLFFSPNYCSTRLYDMRLTVCLCL